MSNPVPSIDEVTPAWGSLPAEQYLVRHWDPTSPTSDVEQRRRLVSSFLSLDTIPKEWDGVRTPVIAEDVEARDICVPNADEVAHILIPWRSQRWRSAAVAIWQQLSGHEVIWLRTHYADQDDGSAKLQEWLDEDPSFNPDQAFWRVLDDAEVFGFETKWECVLNILPEIASAPQRYSRVIDGPDASDYERNTLAECRDRLREEVRNAIDKEGQVEVSVTGIKLQLMACKRLLIVADEEAFETDRLLFLFLDAWGDMIIRIRLSPEDISDVVVPFESGRLADMEWFRDDIYNGDNGAALGVKYTASGERGLQLYRTEDLIT